MARHRWMAVPVAAWVVVCLLTNAARAQTHERSYALDLRLDCPQQNILIGDEIPIVFTITNRDKDPFTCDDRNGDRSGRLPEYELVARYADGTTVPDPREQGLPVIGGGLSSGRNTLRTDASFQKTIALNRWARITKPGRYSVTGIYHYDVRDTDRKQEEGVIFTRDIRVKSRPIVIEVGPRSRREMGRYIHDLTVHLESLRGKQDRQAQQEREKLAARLAYTCDRRIVPTMLDLLYDKSSVNAGFEARQAFCCYVPPDEGVRAAVLGVIKTRGLIRSMGTVMKRLGVSEADAAEVIRTSLASNEREAVFAALDVIQEYPADEHVPRLVAIALDPNSIVPHGSVYVLAMHRTDEGVAALRKLLSDPDPDVRKNTLSSVRAAYWAHPCYPEQADEVYTKTLVSIAANPDNPYRYDVIREIVQTRTQEGADAIRKLLADPNARIPLADTDFGVRAIRDLLRDEDADVRETAHECVKWACYETPGRVLRPDDFPAEYEEVRARRRRSVEKWLQAG
jgi:hypothetical protein